MSYGCEHCTMSVEGNVHERWDSMALYEYKCPECEDSFDLMRPMSASDDPASCPGCGSENAARVMTSSFVSIGSGAAQTATNPMMDARMARGAAVGGCCGGGGCGCH